MGVVTTFTFTSDTETVTRTKLNNLVANLLTEFNGSIDNSNVKSGAGIVASKLDLSAPGEIGGTTPAQMNATILTASTELRLLDGDTNYAGWKANSTLAGNVVWELPGADGNAGQIMATNGSAVMSFVGQNLVQRVNTETGAVTTTTTAIPLDDTIPQSGEGAEFMTLAITPTNTNNILYIDIVCLLAQSNAGANLTAALFQDSTANALGAIYSNSHNIANGAVALVFRHKMTAGTESETTFKIRGGSASGATTTFNGHSGGRIFGGVMASSITITEVAV